MDTFYKVVEHMILTARPWQVLLPVPYLSRCHTFLPLFLCHHIFLPRNLDKDLCILSDYIYRYKIRTHICRNAVYCKDSVMEKPFTKSSNMYSRLGGSPLPFLFCVTHFCPSFSAITFFFPAVLTKIFASCPIIFTFTKFGPTFAARPCTVRTVLWKTLIIERELTARHLLFSLDWQAPVVGLRLRLRNCQASVTDNPLQNH